LREKYEKGKRKKRKIGSNNMRAKRPKIKGKLVLQR
jgi:hypothetical protein